MNVAHLCDRRKTKLEAQLVTKESDSHPEKCPSDKLQRMTRRRLPPSPPRSLCFRLLKTNHHDGLPLNDPDVRIRLQEEHPRCFSAPHAMVAQTTSCGRAVAAPCHRRFLDDRRR